MVMTRQLGKDRAVQQGSPRGDLAELKDMLAACLLSVYKSALHNHALHHSDHQTVEGMIKGHTRAER